MPEATTRTIATLATLLGMDAETILTQSLHGFVAKQIVHTQQRISQLCLDQQRFVQKYGMSLDAFMHALDAMEEQPEEDATIQGVSLLEAVADSRWWAHVQEDLAAETAKLEQLQTLHK